MADLSKWSQKDREALLLATIRWLRSALGVVAKRWFLSRSVRMFVQVALHDTEMYERELPCPQHQETMMFQKPTDEQLAHRFTHHPPVGNQAERYAAIRAKVLETAKFIVAETPCCREQTRALNALDEAMFLANAAIARHEH